jgi:hypothetical protein
VDGQTDDCSSLGLPRHTQHQAVLLECCSEAKASVAECCRPGFPVVLGCSQEVGFQSMAHQCVSAAPPASSIVHTSASMAVVRRRRERRGGECKQCWRHISVRLYKGAAAIKYKHSHCQWLHKNGCTSCTWMLRNLLPPVVRTGPHDSAWRHHSTEGASACVAWCGHVLARCSCGRCRPLTAEDKRTQAAAQGHTIAANVQCWQGWIRTQACYQQCSRDAPPGALPASPLLRAHACAWG